MSLFAKAKKAKENKKGFTLVELIVVLVILAILAAMLVPALTGWIDEARKKQFVLAARNVYMATQAAIDEEYATTGVLHATEDAGIIDDLDPLGVRISALSDYAFDSITIKGYTVTDGEIQSMEIKGLVVGTSGDDATVDATLADGAWDIVEVSSSSGSDDGDESP